MTLRPWPVGWLPMQSLQLIGLRLCLSFSHKKTPGDPGVLFYLEGAPGCGAATGAIFSLIRRRRRGQLPDRRSLPDAGHLVHAVDASAEVRLSPLAWRSASSAERATFMSMAISTSACRCMVTLCRPMVLIGLFSSIWLRETVKPSAASGRRYREQATENRTAGRFRQPNGRR